MQKDNVLSPQLDEFLGREIAAHKTDNALGVRVVDLAGLKRGEEPYLEALAEYDSLSETATAERHTEYRNFFQDALASVGVLLAEDVGDKQISALGAAVRQSYLKRKPPEFEAPETASPDIRLDRQREEGVEKRRPGYGDQGAERFPRENLIGIPGSVEFRC